MWGFFGTAACRPIVPLPPISSLHSSPEAPRTTQARETSASEWGNYTRNFASTFVIHGGTGFFHMPQSWNMGGILSLPRRRKACGGCFRCPKNPPEFAGLNPRTRVPEASMLTTRPTKPSSHSLLSNVTESTTPFPQEWKLYLSLQL